MGSALYSIGRACGALAGLSAAIFTDMTNVGDYGPGFLPPAPGSPVTFIDPAQVYSISFDRGSASFGTDSVSDQSGDYGVSKLTGFVPLSRATVETLLRRLRNRPILVIGIDRLGSQHVIYEARTRYRHTTGGKPGTAHGYSVEFVGSTHYILPAIAGEGDIDTAPPVGGVVPGGGGSSECCVTINPVNIAYTPTPTGNALNRNEIVTTINGSLYFIDGDGRGIILNRPAPRYYRGSFEGVSVSEITLPMDFPLPDPDDYPLPTYDENAEISVRLKVKYGSRWLIYDHPEGFTIDHANHKVLFPSGIEGGYVEMYSYEGIPPRPL